MIAIRGLKKHFGSVEALRGIDLEVASGSLFGVLGADGAGKSTLFSILSTLQTADSGTVAVLGLDPATQAALLRPRIGWMPQIFSLYEDLSIRENLNFFADIFGLQGTSRQERIGRLLDFSRLTPFSLRRAGRLSGGMKQKLALSCALLHTPELLILDEPTTGVDPVSRKEFWSLLKDINKQGVSIIVSTPYLDEAEYCTEFIIMHEGTIRFRGKPTEVPQGIHKLFFELLTENSGVKRL